MGKPTLLDILLGRKFDIPTVAKNAGVDSASIDRMLNSLPVYKEEAQKVLKELNLSLETVHVVLRTKSEYVSLNDELEQQFIAAMRGLTDLAEGTAEHEFMIAKTERMAELSAMVASKVGEERLMELLSEI